MEYEYIEAFHFGRIAFFVDEELINNKIYYRIKFNELKPQHYFKFYNDYYNDYNIIVLALRMNLMEFKRYIYKNYNGFLIDTKLYFNTREDAENTIEWMKSILITKKLMELSGGWYGYVRR